MKQLTIKISFERIIILILSIVVYTFIVLVVSDISFGPTIYKSEQPSSINYESYDPYEIIVEKGPIKWNSIGFPRMNIIRITSKDNSYGIYIRSDIYIENENDIKVKWSKEGIRLIYSKGYELFISKDRFTDDR